MISFVNSGRINLRVRGNKKTQLQTILSNLRQKTVQLVKSQSVKAKERVHLPSPPITTTTTVSDGWRCLVAVAILSVSFKYIPQL